MDQTEPQRRHSARTVALLLFVSGACALVFQIVWMRELRHIFGSTTASSAAVVAVFMGGVGAGNAFFGRRLDQTINPLAKYAMLEFGIAVSVAVSPMLVGLTHTVYVALGGQASLGAWGATTVRLAGAVLVLALPTFLMGGTVPAAAKAIASENDPRRRGVALVYATNTLGAVLGAGLANFWLLEVLGNRTLLWLTCGLNLALAMSALAIANRLPGVENVAASRAADSRQPRRASTNKPAGESQAKNSPVGFVYFSAGTVGLAFFLMEIVWYRMLAPLLGGTTYTFGLILGVALAGIGIGGAAYHVLAPRIKPGIATLAATCALEAMCIALPFWAGDSIAFQILNGQTTQAVGFWSQILDWLGVAGLVVFPAAAVAGFQFPLLVAMAGSGREQIAKHVGLTLAANTLGAILGSLIGGFVALPLLGAPLVWQAVVCLLIALAMAACLWPPRRIRLVTCSAAAMCVLAGWAILQTGPTAVWRHSGIGASRAMTTGDGPNTQKLFANTRRRQTVWESEGLESSVAITATDGLSLIVNGKSDGNSVAHDGTQIGLGLMGPLLHPEPQTGLVSGLGTGESAGWLADTETMTHVDIVELEPAVIEMAKRCSDLNRNVLDNEKVELHFNDARESLLTSGSAYDLIVSEPSNPYRAGVATLYTREFYESASNKLNPQGLFLQWLQAYEVDSRTVRIVLKTLTSVFPNVQVWRTRTHDLLLVCGKSTESFPASQAGLQDRLADPVIAAGLLRAWRVADVEGVLAHYVCSEPTITAFVAQEDVPRNTDDKNALEYTFARTVGQTTSFAVQELEALAIANADALPPGIKDLDEDKVARRRLAMHAMLGGQDTLNELASAGNNKLASALAFYASGDYAKSKCRVRACCDR